MPKVRKGRSPHELLTREEFVRLVFSRDRGKCVFCNNPAVDAHHILERRLFPDGGYYLDNGASVCKRHHWDCETTVISVEETRSACGIKGPVLPPGFDPSICYDKWGNVVNPDKSRIPGPLFGDPGTQKALAKGGFLDFFSERRD